MTPRSLVSALAFAVGCTLVVPGMTARAQGHEQAAPPAGELAKIPGPADIIMPHITDSKHIELPWVENSAEWAHEVTLPTWNVKIGEGKTIPDNSLVVGVPGKILGEVREEQAARMRNGTRNYVANWRRYRAGLRPVPG